MRIGNVFTVAVFLGIGALALPTAKPNNNLRDVAMRRVMSEEGSSAAIMRHRREVDISANKNCEEECAFRTHNGEASAPGVNGCHKGEVHIPADKSYQGIGDRKRAEKDSSDKTIKDSPDKTIKDSPDKTIKDSPDSSDTSVPDKNAKGNGKRDDKDTPDKIVKDTPDTIDVSKPDKNAKKPKNQ